MDTSIRVGGGRLVVYISGSMNTVCCIMTALLHCLLIYRDEAGHPKAP